jgi:predicted DNA-binding transcriptional regulator AlpA
MPDIPEAASGPHPERRIPAADVRAICGGVSDMWLHRRLSDSDFPRPILIANRRYWKEREVLAWLDRQEVA